VKGVVRLLSRWWFQLVSPRGPRAFLFPFMYSIEVTRMEGAYRVMSTELSKRALLSKGALSAGVGLGVLGLFAERTSADTPFTTFAFPATGAPTPRTMPDRLAEVINVRDFGAVGNGVNDDTRPIQAALDAAFTTGGIPHGTNSHLNRPVYFPTGYYKVYSPLMLRDVMGGHIFGASKSSTRIEGSGVARVFDINGMSNTLIENLTVANPPLSGTVCFYLDWTNTGSVGLSDVEFVNVGVESAYYGFRIAPSNHGGKNISMTAMYFSALVYGASIEGDDCIVSAPFGGSSTNTGASFWIKKGSLFCGFQFAGEWGGVDILHESAAGITVIYGARSENTNWIKCTAGRVVAYAFQFTGTLMAGQSGYAVDVSAGASVDLAGVRISCFNGPNVNGWVQGAGNISLHATVFEANPSGPLFLKNFTGKLTSYIGPVIFTYAQLPTANAAEGLMLSMSNANTAAWGQPVTDAGANHALVRYNGSAWTVVGI